MPLTINGVGTRYVGRQNVLTRAGLCSHCGRASALESCDTREWFVVAYLPLIPLGRYHLLDECPHCRRHRRIGKAVWETEQEHARLEAESLLRQRPGEPQAAIEAHSRLLAFQLVHDAQALEAAMSEQYARVPEVLVHFAQCAASAGRAADALRHYELAHQADPSNPGAREGLALAAVREGRPDRALELLEPVLESGSMQSSAAGCAIGSALVSARRYEEAQRVLLATLESFPMLGSVKSFAKDLARCEKALGRPRSKLPGLRQGRKRWLQGAALAAVALVGLLAADVWAGRHRKLYVVESVAGRVKVEIPGQQTLEFGMPGVREVELPEGSYRALVSGPVQREVAFTVSSASWPRFLDKSVCVLDASGDSLLTLEENVYSTLVSERRFGGHLLFGQDFRRIDRVDFAFEAFPARIRVENGQTSLSRWRVDFVDAPLEAVVYDLIGRKDPRQAFELARWGLQREPDNGDRLDCFVAAAQAAHIEVQALSVLAPRLEARPVQLAAHRAFLDLLKGEDGRAQAITTYRDLRQREAQEPVWPYLLARLSTRLSERRELLEAILDGEAPAGAWSLMAETQASDLEWPLALESAEKALEVGDADGSAFWIRAQALDALGRSAQLDEEYSAALLQSPCEAGLALLRFERLPPETSDAELVQRLTEWQQAARKSCPGFEGSWVVYVHAWCALGRGDVDTLVHLDATTKDGSLRWLLASALAGQGRLVDARQYLEGRLRCEIEPYDALALALACRVGGDEAQGAAWEARARKELASGVDAQVARLLAGERRGLADEALDLALLPWRKSIVLALLSLADETDRSRLLDAARQLQSRPIFPRRIIEELAAKSVRR